MKRKLFGKAASIMLALSVGMGGFSLPSAKAELNALVRLTVNYMTDPLGIDAPVSFGWQLSSNEIGQKQTAYDISVKNGDGQVVWRSGKIESDQTTGIAFGGEKLLSGEEYSWTVKAYGSDGKFFAENSAKFEMGVSDDSQWEKAQFICMPRSESAPIFRKAVPLKGKVKSARLYVTAVGVYEARINGEKVYKIENGERVYHHMNPGYGNPNVFLPYETYDVTPLMGEESAVVTFTASTGWSDENGNFVMGNTTSRPGVKAMLKICYENGESESIVTDSKTWRGTLEGPITAAGIYYGEDYSALKAEALGEYWLYDYDDSAWMGGGGNQDKEYAAIKNEFEPVSARYLRLRVKAVGPAENGAGESLLQIMELEAYAKGENVAKGKTASAQNSWSPNGQWAIEHLTDGDDGKSTDAGYTSKILAKGSLKELTLSEPIDVDVDLGEAAALDCIKIKCRTKTGSVAANICPNYPKVYDVLVSDDGENWQEIITDYNAGDVYISDPGALGALEYKGKIKAASGMSGRIVDKFEQQAVSAVIYSKTKENSTYAGGEIEIDRQYCGENIFRDGIELKAGETMVVNMGQNMSAVPEIKVKGQRGGNVVMKFAEMLNDGSASGDRFGNGGHNASGPKGSVYIHSLRGARSEARYVLSGNGVETYQPSASFFGYQYISLTTDCDITVYGLRSRAVSSVSRQTGKIETNNADVNRLFLNALYGQLSNYFTIPTDCNQRDERLAWTGDAQAFANTALYNFDCAAFLSAWQDILSENTLLRNYPSAVTAPFGGYFDHWATGWSDVEVINIWELFQKTGDKSLVEKNWEALEKYHTFLRNNERAPYMAPDPTKHVRTYGDWLAFQGTNHQIVSDNYYGYVTLLMQKMALALDKQDEAQFYGEYFENQKEAYLRRHVVYNLPDSDAVVLPRPKNKAGENTITVDLKNQTARYVKITVTQTGPGTSNDNEYRLQIMEEEIYNAAGENAALGKKATTNNDFNAYGWTINNLTDADEEKGYSSKDNKTAQISSAPIYVTVDLGESETLTALKLKCRVFESTMEEGVCPNFPKKFTAELSNDGEEWALAGSYSVRSENEEEDILTIKSGVYAPGHFDMNKAGVLEDNSQTALIWMLKLGWYKDDAMRQEAIRLLCENIRNETPEASSVRSKYGKNTLAVGFLGCNVIAPVLTDVGKSAVSYDLLLNTELPSWLFEVKAGATTVWERWNSYDPENGFGDAEMNSFNHFAYGSVAEWMYRYMAGIETAEGEGFKNIILQPTPDKGEQYNDEERIRTVSATYESARGEIAVDWESDEAGSITSYEVKIPANTKATLYLPADGKKEISVPYGVKYLGKTEHNGLNCEKFELESGGYVFEADESTVTAALAQGYVGGESGEEEPKMKIEAFDGESVKITSSFEQSGRIIAALYDSEKRLIWEKSIDADIKSGENTVSLGEAMPQGGKFAKIMFWKNKSLSPVCKSFEIEQK